MNAAIATAADGNAGAPVPHLTRRWRAPLHVFLGTLFTLLIITAGGAIGWYNYAQNRSLTIAAADNLFRAMAREMRAELDAIRNPAQLLIDLLARERIGAATSFDERMGSVTLLTAALKHEPALLGDLRRLRQRRFLPAPAVDRHAAREHALRPTQGSRVPGAEHRTPARGWRASRSCLRRRCRKRNRAA